MRIDILTLFPDAVGAMMHSSILGRAEAKGILDIHCVQIRDYTTNRQQQVDDYPYGGGWGCVMMAQPLKACLDDVVARSGERRRRVIYMSPQGKRFDQSEARRLVRDYDHLVLVCGHYEGVDERFITSCCDEEMSVGDFVLTGGEIPAMAIADAVCRMVPGVLSDPACYEGESHWEGLLEYPQYTRPEVWEGLAVPPVLLRGDHAEVEIWRREQQLQRTLEKRPDLFEQFVPQTESDRRTVARLTHTEKPVFDCRKARVEDIPEMLSVTAEASAFLKQCGVDQWQDGFPNRAVLEQDIARGNCWLFTCGEELAGLVSVYMEEDDDYTASDAAWLTPADSRYGVIHRTAARAKYRGTGLATEMVQLAEDIIQGSGCGSVRADTHPDNQVVRRLLTRRGYTECGTVWLKGVNGGAKRHRIGFEKCF